MKIKFAKIFLLVLLLAIKVIAQNKKSVMLKLPDTGQQSSYTLTFGEDADFNINPPFYILNNAAILSDTVTGLMWQRADAGEMTYENALIYADTCTLGAYTDWRLPNALEAFSILNFQTQNPAVDLNYFIKTNAEYWWTSDLQVNDNAKVWVTNSGGGVGNHAKSETISAGGIKKFHLRLVRTLKAKLINADRFAKLVDGTVYDSLTNLIWQKTPYADTLTWEQALTYADTLTQAGYSDWRLPNIKELQSIQDITAINPSLNTNYFNVFGRKKFWSATTLSNKNNSAWYFDTQFGITTYQTKTTRLNTWVLRGGQLATNIHWNEYPLLLTVFPNPCQAQLNIQFNSKANLKSPYITVTNAIGKIIYQAAVPNASFRLNTSEYPKGIYYLAVFDGNSLSSIKFVVN
ncbi:MAG: hypothetical protein RIR80_243 [Bacteroidota bacterium]